MKVGDRVRHKRLGIGTVKALYPKHTAARVLYDSGHETTNSQKRVEVLTAGQGVNETPSQAQPQPTKRRRSSGSVHVDYDRLERARSHFQDEHPDMTVIPRVYGGRVYVELWYDDGHATIEFYDTD